MAYSLTSGTLTAALRSVGIDVSAATIQRYARQGKIPSRPTPGGRYRYDLQEVLTALRRTNPAAGLGAPVLTGGLGSAELPADSAAERLRRQVRGHASVVAPMKVPARSSAMHEQLAQATRRSLALA